ncbi:SDR family oxidoreductase [Marinicella rhabdoformis]|uniref:SDR family oxidoreductase n=1 Tax=Marinicella rhabdoformis TaxID=2580566 RepID=UPI0012AECC66|nr:SDR family oxidoreductase [Marinicella rhabdoformis]
MSFNWKNQTVVLTGAYGGLGHVLAEALSEQGADLVLLGRDSNKLQQLQSALKHTSDVVVGDISDRTTTSALKTLLENKQSPEHMLINNAALSDASFLNNSDEADIENVLKVNLLTPIVLSKQLMPWLQQAEHARIINIGSSFGGIGYPGFSTYCASKFGLRGFTQALNRELINTTVNAQYLAPRAMATGINTSAVNALNEKLGNAVDKPQKIARWIISSIEKNHSEKFYGWPEKLFVKINALLPNMVSKAISKDQKTIQSYLNKKVNS